MSETTAKVIGAVLGILLGGWLLVVAPMMENYERGGCIFIVCDTGQRDKP